MTLWDLFFTSQPTTPPQLGVWYFLLPTSLVVVGGLSIRFAHSKGYQNFWYWGQLIQLLMINVWYIAAHLPFSESLPFYHSRMAMWIILLAPKGSFKQYLLLLASLAPSWPWFILSFIPILFLMYPRSTMSLATGPLGQLLDLSGSILPGGRKGCLENLSDDCWGQCHYSACESRNRWKLRLYASPSCDR